MLVNKPKIKKSYYAIAWTIFLVAFAVGMVGNLLGLFAVFPFFDEVMHLLTSLGLAMVISLHLFARSLMGAWRSVVTFVLAATLVTVGVGALWEIAEWAYVQAVVAGEIGLSQGDTVTDLALDFGGGLIGAIFGAMMARASVPERGVVAERDVIDVESPAAA